MSYNGCWIKELAWIKMILEEHHYMMLQRTDKLKFVINKNYVHGIVSFV